jgi:hypothetical protein
MNIGINDRGNFEISTMRPVGILENDGKYLVAQTAPSPTKRFMVNA